MEGVMLSMRSSCCTYANRIGRFIIARQVQLRAFTPNVSELTSTSQPSRNERVSSQLEGSDNGVRIMK